MAVTFSVIGILSAFCRQSVWQSVWQSGGELAPFFQCGGGRGRGVHGHPHADFHAGGLVGSARLGWLGQIYRSLGDPREVRQSLVLGLLVVLVPLAVRIDLENLEQLRMVAVRAGEVEPAPFRLPDGVRHVQGVDGNAVFGSKRFGKLSLGKGDSASNNSAEVDLSKVDVIAYASVADIAGGILFREKNGDDTLTNVSVSDAFKDLDGLSRRNRVRYDTPTFSGFHLATSAISNQRYDGSLWWSGQGYGFKAAGAVAVAYPNQDNTDLQYDGSFSLLHEATGLNLTLSAGLQERDNQGDASNFYTKVGWLTRFFSFGETAFGVDFTRSMNLPTGTDDGFSVGAAAVQQFEDYGTELYVQYRIYSLDRGADPNVQDINVGTIGARVKF